MAKDLTVWIEARKRFRLSHMHIQMARELGLNPKKFGSLGSNNHEQWKEPLPQFIEDIYFKHFKRESPLEVVTIEQKIKADKAKSLAKKEKRRKQRLEKLDPPI